MCQTYSKAAADEAPLWDQFIPVAYRTFQSLDPCSLRHVPMLMIKASFPPTSCKKVFSAVVQIESK